MRTLSRVLATPLQLVPFAGNLVIYCFVLYFTVDYGPYDQYLMEWEEQIKNDPGFPLHILYYEDLKDVSAYPAATQPYR